MFLGVAVDSAVVVGGRVGCAGGIVGEVGSLSLAGSAGDINLDTMFCLVGILNFWRTFMFFLPFTAVMDNIAFGWKCKLVKLCS